MEGLWINVYIEIFAALIVICATQSKSRLTLFEDIYTAYEVKGNWCE
jgi:hypothetical protein